jgi:sulfur carrier protein
MSELILNGECRCFPDETLRSVAALITHLGYTGKRIAVELNGEIVPRSQHASTPLASNDRLEIVVAVGGG